MQSESFLSGINWGSVSGDRWWEAQSPEERGRGHLLSPVTESGWPLLASFHYPLGWNGGTVASQFCHGFLVGLWSILRTPGSYPRLFPGCGGSISAIRTLRAAPPLYMQLRLTVLPLALLTQDTPTYRAAF